MKQPMRQILGLVAVLAAIGASAGAVASDLGRGSGATVTKAAWAWRITRTDEDSPCAALPQPACRSTTLTIENTSAQAMACVAQMRFSLVGAAQVNWTENAGLTVEPGAAVAAIVTEFADKLDIERSTAVCWTTQERDEAESGDAPFARAAPPACKVQLVSSPGLEEYFPNGAMNNDEAGLVSVRIALPVADGPPKVLGINATSGFLRIDRAALLVASRMQFKTNCPGTQRILPIRFQVQDAPAK